MRACPADVLHDKRQPLARRDSLSYAGHLRHDQGPLSALAPLAPCHPAQAPRSEPSPSAKLSPGQLTPSPQAHELSKCWSLFAAKLLSLGGCLCCHMTVEISKLYTASSYFFFLFKGTRGNLQLRIRFIIIKYIFYFLLRK